MQPLKRWDGVLFYGAKGAGRGVGGGGVQSGSFSGEIMLIWEENELS